MRRTWILLALLFIVVAALPAAAGVLAQGDYDLTWWTADGSGGAGSGDGYTLVGTAGQADAATWSDGEYTLQGGFWPADTAYALFLPLILK
jgi:hypothetical protein